MPLLLELLHDVCGYDLGCTSALPFMWYTKLIGCTRRLEEEGGHTVYVGLLRGWAYRLYEGRNLGPERGTTCPASSLSKDGQATYSVRGAYSIGPQGRRVRRMNVALGHEPCAGLTNI